MPPSPTPFVFHNQRNLSVFRLDKVGKGLWLSVVVVDTIGLSVVTMSVVIVVVSILGRANILHLVDGTTLRAALYRTITRALHSVSMSYPYRDS